MLEDLKALVHAVNQENMEASDYKIDRGISLRAVWQRFRPMSSLTWSSNVQMRQYKVNESFQENGYGMSILPWLRWRLTCYIVQRMRSLEFRRIRHSNELTNL